MRKRDMIYITVEIQTSPVALRYLGVMIWEIHIRELWEYFKFKSSIYGLILRMRKMTSNRAYAPMSSHPDSEDLFGIELLYLFCMWLSRLDRDPPFVCVCVFSFQPRILSWGRDTMMRKI